MSLRSILGRSGRVNKKKSSTTTAKSSPSPSSAWADSLPRRKPGSSGGSIQKKKTNNISSANGLYDEYDDDDVFEDKLDDYGLVRALGTDLNLRDTAQAIRHVRNHMFSPLPESGAGMNSTRIAEVLNFRRRLPAIVTVSHVQALLSSPSAVEREIAELARTGIVLKVVVARPRGVGMGVGSGETLILSSDFEALVRESSSLDDEAAGHGTTTAATTGTRDRFLTYLRDHHTSSTTTTQEVLPGGILTTTDISRLVKAGFLTSHHTASKNHAHMSETINLYSRAAEDKGSLISIETVSRQATGTIEAVGGEGAFHYAGGGGGKGLPGSDRHSRHKEQEDKDYSMKLSIPGNGTFLNLVSTALDHLVSLIERSNKKFRELPESTLRERWDGGLISAGKRARAGENKLFSGILPGQTRKWRQFQGLSFDWVLREAVGAGLVEVFRTGSVGRGVRVI